MRYLSVLEVFTITNRLCLLEGDFKTSTVCIVKCRSIFYVPFPSEWG